ncbi:MAG: dihydrolipoyl dehydrogenase [Chromatiales bacterium]|nr:dihydrolipoyl dehydrogenase [Chromatiales bacterium]
MAKIVDVRLPDIGDFDKVDVIEVLVTAGDRISVDDSLITLESDKATMEIPSPHAGVVKETKVTIGDKISQGDLILTMEVDVSTGAAKPAADKPAVASQAAPASGKEDMHAEVLVLGAGPGGYTAAFRAADLGKKVILVERYPSLGGVCLNVGCIPSKALLHIAQIINESREMGAHGVTFGEPQIDLAGVNAFKDKTVAKLTGGLKALAKQRNVEVVQGVGRFISGRLLEVAGEGGKTVIGFDNAIIAAGSQAVKIPVFPNDDPRLWDSTDALRLDHVPQRLLIVGGGIIGLEMATVYHALGAEITVVELMDSLIPGCDKDLVKPLEKIIRKRYKDIYLGTKVTAVEAGEAALTVRFEGPKAPAAADFDAVLVAVGRRPNGNAIGLENAGVHVDERGFVPVDRQQRTNVPHIFAIGDIVGQPMLAHKATHEAKVAAEVIAGHKSFFDALTIPSVAYTDPEVAWMGLTETEAKAKGIAIEKGAFPWAASGRALGIGRDEGMTKILIDKETRRVVGAGMVGVNAGELVAEAVLALEMGADAEDIGLSVHPHPTLSETFAMAAEMVEGSITDLMPPKKR